LKRDARRAWLLASVLLVATFGTMLVAGVAFERAEPPRTLPELAAGWTFAVPMLGILLTHELGHYIAARRHGVPVSPPYFIPVPLFLGTFGAILLMRGRIRSRAALVDIGAAGPLAGLVVAVPVLAYGLATSPVVPKEPGMVVEGRSLLYLAMRSWFAGPIPEGHDVLLTPTAAAGWGGLLVTMMNLVPVGQLDGGHVAYALFGRRQDRWSTRVHALLPVVGLLVSGWFLVDALGREGGPDALLSGALAGMNWIVWSGVLLLLRRVGGASHPRTDPGTLGPMRRGIAVLTLVLFVLLFMPSWIRTVA